MQANWALGVFSGQQVLSRLPAAFQRHVQHSRLTSLFKWFIAWGARETTVTDLIHSFIPMSCFSTLEELQLIGLGLFWWRTGGLPAECRKRFLHGPSLLDPSYFHINDSSSCEPQIVQFSSQCGSKTLLRKMFDFIVWIKDASVWNNSSVDSSSAPSTLVHSTHSNWLVLVIRCLSVVDGAPRNTRMKPTFLPILWWCVYFSYSLLFGFEAVWRRRQPSPRRMTWAVVRSKK